MKDAVKDHDKNVLALLERCRDKEVKLNKEKFTCWSRANERWFEARFIKDRSNSTR